MLLVVDVGNTQTHFGTCQGDELVEHWRFATVRESTADELGARAAQPARAARRRRSPTSTPRSSRRRSRSSGPSGRRWRALPRPRDARRRARHPDRHGDPLRQPARDRRRPPGQRRRRATRRSAAPCVVRRLRHGDHLRPGLGARASTSAASSRPGVEISMEALTERAAALPRDRHRPAALADRQVDGRRDPPRHRLRLRRPGRRDRRAACAASSARRPRRSRPAAWPATSSRSRRRSTRSTTCSRSTGLQLLHERNRA